ncbi:MAG: HNH endonuclease [Bacteroidales bacterium]
MEDFKNVFKYDPQSPSGLVWLISRGKAKIGKSCGNIKGNGYYQVGFKGKYYPCHRIVWILEKGEIPSGKVIDHIDNNTLNNCIGNLRLSTIQGNTRNRVKRLNLTSKFKGVCWNKRSGSWKVSIVVDSKSIHLGYFKDEELAGDAYKKASLEYFGEFAWRDDV